MKALKLLDLEKSQIICARMDAMDADRVSYNSSEKYYEKTYENNEI